MDNELLAEKIHRLKNGVPFSGENRSADRDLLDFLEAAVRLVSHVSSLGNPMIDGMRLAAAKEATGTKCGATWPVAIGAGPGCAGGYEEGANPLDRAQVSSRRL